MFLKNLSLINVGIDRHNTSVYLNWKLTFFTFLVCRFLDWVLDVGDYLEYTKQLLSLMNLDVQ